MADKVLEQLGLSSRHRFCVVRAYEALPPTSEAVDAHPTAASLAVRAGTTLGVVVDKMRLERHVGYGAIVYVLARGEWHLAETEILAYACVEGDRFYFKLVLADPPHPRPGPSSSLTKLCDDAAIKAAELRREHSALTLDALSDHAQTSTFTSVDGVAMEMIGRECIGKLINFIRESTVRSFKSLNFVLGSTSCGKTYCVRAASLFLFLEFETSKRGRLVYVDGDRFPKDPAGTLLVSFALAYHDSSTARHLIENLKDDKDVERVITIMRKTDRAEKDRRLYLLLDGGPEISADDGNVLRKIAGFGAVILCGKWQQYLRERDRSFFIDGAFNGAEVTSFLAFLKRNDTKESIWWRTGWVPGMIAARSQHKYRAALKKYIQGLSDEDVPRFSSLISTGEVDDDDDDEDEDDVLPEQATGLFYRGADGSVRCLSEALRSYASVQLMGQGKLKDQKLVDSLMGIVCRERRRKRGWRSWRRRDRWG